MKTHALLAALALMVVSTNPSSAQPASLPHGVAAGDTTETSTVLWARSLSPGLVRFQYSRRADFRRLEGVAFDVVQSPDVPAKVFVHRLQPGTEYFYRAIDARGSVAAGRFVTAGRCGRRGGLRFGVSGDWRGELLPYSAVKNVPARRLDFFVALGDTIYADFPSPEVPAEQATTLEEFRAKHAEVYSSDFGLNALADVRASTSTFAMIDDHEVTNDFAGGASPASDPRFAGDPAPLINETQLFRRGLRAFHEYNPLRPAFYFTPSDPRTHLKPKLYRSQTYGDDAAIFLLDARSFRDAELPGVTSITDPAAVQAFLIRSFDLDPATLQPLPARTMLSATQLKRLLLDLREAEAAGVTWKFICVPEPIQNLGVLGAGDRFEGYAAERTRLLAAIEAAGIRNVVFISADIHGTLVNDLTYQLGPGQPQIPTRMFEITTGSVAFDAPFGPTVVALASAIPVAPGVSLFDFFLAQAGLSRAIFDALPNPQKDSVLEAFINAQLDPLGYSEIGLQDSTVPATLLAGRYSSMFTYGWTEFAIDAKSQDLTVTTYGIPFYTVAEVSAETTARTPAIVSRFIVKADTTRPPGRHWATGKVCEEGVTAPCGIERALAGAQPARMIANPAEVRLSELVEHADYLDAQVSLTAAQAEFARRGRRFLGVIESGRFVGMASEREITQLLSQQFGHALFGRLPVRQHVMKDALAITPDEPLTELLKLTAARNEAAFYHDIALISAQREFLGFIPVHRIVRLQTSLLLANLAEVEEQRRELAARNRQMEEDLRMAREVQLALLPDRPTRIEYAGRVVETQHIYEPADVIGGDFFAVFSPAAGVVTFCMCDVMGHGVRPALITAILCALLEESRAQAADPGAVLTQINRSLQSVLRSVGDLIFVTAAYGVIDLARGELRYAQAGHPTPFLWRASASTAAELPLDPDAAGPALGLLDDFSYATTACAFGPGDALMLYTDGVLEVVDSGDVEFGGDRLRASFAEALARGGPDIAPAVVETARRFAGVRRFPDDVCVLVARCSAGAEISG